MAELFRLGSGGSMGHGDDAGDEGINSNNSSAMNGKQGVMVDGLEEWNGGTRSWLKLQEKRYLPSAPV